MPPAATQLESLQRKLAAEKVVLACVAEVSRGKSELLNAIFFADTGRRVLPASPGRTTMCPVELHYKAGQPSELALLPIDTRLGGPVAGRTARPARCLAAPEPRRTQPAGPGRGAEPGDADPARRHRPGGGAGFLERHTPARQPAAGRGRHGRGAGLAPCADQLPAPLAAARPGGGGHAGAQRHRCRARADAGAAAVGARDHLPARRRHRRVALRPGHLGRASVQRRTRTLRRAQQDRHAGRPAVHAGGGGAAARHAPDQGGPDAAHAAAAHLRAVGARRAGRACRPRRRRAAAQRPAGSGDGAGPRTAAAAARTAGARQQRGAARAARRGDAPPRRAPAPQRRADARAARPAWQERREGACDAAAPGCRDDRLRTLQRTHRGLARGAPAPVAEGHRGAVQRVVARRGGGDAVRDGRAAAAPGRAQGLSQAVRTPARRAGDGRARKPTRSSRCSAPATRP